MDVMMPVMAHNILQSIELLSNAVRAFEQKCLAGLEADHVGEEGGGEEQIQGPRQGREQDVGNGPWVVVEADSEVEQEDVLDVVEVLHPERLVEPEPLSEDVLCLRRDQRVSGELRGDITRLGVDQEEEDGQEDQEQDEHLE